MTESTAVLAERLATLNAAYRAGIPEVSDEVYDDLVEQLRSQQPDHPFLNSVEPEPEELLGTLVRLAVPLLSTEKSYTQANIDKWVANVRRAADSAGITDITVEVTPKLDGLAGYWDGETLASRGDGVHGQDLTRNVARGLVIDQSLIGPGEIVVNHAYFTSHIEQQFGMATPRNFMVGLVAADTVKPHHAAALAAGVCRFEAYARQPRVILPIDEFQRTWSDVNTRVRAMSDYLTDGSVVEVVNPKIREILGSATTHHRYMLAIKTRGETGITTIRALTPQVGRTGRIVHVAELNEIRLSGAVIRRCTTHTAGHVRRLGLGPGAIVEICRSGEVIPFLTKVITPSTVETDMSVCPSCGTKTVWENDHLRCPNVDGCVAQASTRLRHWFERLGIKGFGPTICNAFADAGLTDPMAILSLSIDSMVKAGLHAGVASNLVDAIAQRKTEVILDTDAVGALGIHHFGRGDARHALVIHRWQDFARLGERDLLAIAGFGAHTASAIAPHLSKVTSTIQALVDLGFRIEPTVRAADTAGSPIAGKKLVFTGSMPMSREAMEAQARSLGATPQGSVNRTTDLLVVGEKVGAKKTEAAAALGVQVMPVDQYLALLAA